MNTRRLRKIRQRLFLENPHCYWCGCKTVWYTGTGGHDRPANAATLDHLIPRTDPLRHVLPFYPQELLVLCCNKCNNERGKREEGQLRKHISWTTRTHLKKLLTDPKIVVQLSSDYELLPN